MLLHIRAVLSPETRQTVQEMLAGAVYVDGRRSAGREAGQVKHNQELAADDPLRARLDRLVIGALVQHPRYQAAVLPLRVAGAFYARYQAGMNYGFHVDDPVMGPLQGRYRSDVSTTVFLNGADDYEGGELVLRTPLGEQVVKGEAGDAVIYPSSYWHRVADVRSGTRLVAVTWAQSMVRSPEQRELLYQLALAREGVMARLEGSEEAASLSTAYANLVRMWSEV
ncbi:MAG: Fe2+-dependent dioxygenase [Thiothrix sp.]|nr:Fe2+-dependent dioxygenase [Thiothrix sp.]HPQ95173.1 Fe2+-dependent dioxygenase [Thiolinea sp.]